jgi:hypothetical protein
MEGWLTDIVSRCPANPFTHSSFSMSQTPTFRSFPPLARYFPSLLKARARTSSVCPFTSGPPRAFPLPLSFPLICTPVSVLPGRILRNIDSCFPVMRSHLMIEPSFPEVRRYLQSSDATAEVTERRCPRVRRIFFGLSEKSYCDNLASETV